MSDPRKRPRVLFATVGCRANQADSQMLAEALSTADFEVVLDGDAAEPDFCVLNTCTVTHRADADARAAVRRLARRHPGARVVVTGCLAEVDPEEVAALPAVAAVVPNRAKGELAAVLARLVRGAPAPDGGPPWEATSSPVALRPVSAIALPHERARPFLKIQDGCESHCAYCIVPRARGPCRSLPPEEVLASVLRYAALGAGEVVLTGIHVGRYGQDRAAGEEALSLAGLLSGLDTALTAEVGDRPRLRLSSLEPDEVTDELLAALSSPRFCRHLHLPLQTGDDSLLRRMGRPYDAARYRAAVAAARARLPGVTIGADVLVGLPGEGEAEFARTSALVEACGLDYLHVFGYSKRPGTRAAAMADQVSPGVIKSRVGTLRQLDRRLREAFLAGVAGTHAEAVIERSAGARLSGLTGNYVPVLLPAGAGRRGDLVPVWLGRVRGGRVMAVVAR